jgi:hypothetical protein
MGLILVRFGYDESGKRFASEITLLAEQTEPRLPVLNAFKAAIKAGADVEQMVEAARCYASSHATRKIIGTKFIPAAARWLKAERWRDHAPTMSTNPIDLKEPRRLQALEESRTHLG